MLLDMQLPGEDGLHVLEELQKAQPGVAVLVVSMHDEPRFVRAAIYAGAKGYVLKGIGRRELLSAVRAAVAGEVVLDPALVRTVTACPETVLAAFAPTAERLSAIERAVLTHMAEGLTNRQIASHAMERGDGEEVRPAHSGEARRLDRTEAAVAAVRRGLVN